MTTQETNQVKPLFALGKIFATPGAIEAMNGLAIHPISLLCHHQCGDWGDLDQDDKEANDSALNTGSRILSAYQYGQKKFWVISEADRSLTTILLPEEY